MKEATMGTRESDYYHALYQVALTINSSLDPREVLESIARTTAVAMGSKACSIMLLSSNRTEMYHSAAYGLSNWYVRKGALKVDSSMAEALSGHPVAVWDAGTDPRIQYRPQAVKEGIASILTIPMRLREEVIGVMRIYTSEPREFTANEIEFVEIVANLGAVALEKARLFEEVKINYEGIRKDLLEWYATWGLERTADALAGGVSPVEEESTAA